MRRALALIAALACASAAQAGPVRAEGEVCVTNDFEVAWVHPGIPVYLDRDADEACAGESLTLKEGESGCFDTRPVPYDGSHTLRAEDATTAACRTVCPITQAQIRLIFDQSNVYGCGE